MNCYYGWNNDKNILLDSSSGGIFSAFALRILKRKGVVFGASIDFNTSIVTHKRVDSLDELSLLRYSKYQQSIIGKTYSEVEKALNNQSIVLFSGTPCQVSGLLSYLTLKKITTEKLITVEVLCHGVTNTSIVKEYLKSIESKYRKKVKRYYFRTKDKPWYHSGSSIQLVFEDGSKTYRNHAVDEFYLVYGNNIVLRPSCYNCPFAKIEGRLADVTLGDFWGAELFINNKKRLNQGISIILTNTDKGEDLWKDLVDSKVVTSVLLDYKKAVPRNGALVKPAYLNPKREDFFKRFRKEDFLRIVFSMYKKRIIRGKLKLLIGYDNIRYIKVIKELFLNRGW